MKKVIIILITILLSFFVVSCKKEEVVNTANTKYLFHDDIMLLRPFVDLGGYTRDEKYYYFNEKGKIIAGPFMLAEPFYKGYAVADGRIINTKGKFITDEDIIVGKVPYKNDFLYYHKNSDTNDRLRGVIRYDGKIITDTKYSGFDFFDNADLICCHLPNHDIEIINAKGKVMLSNKNAILKIEDDDYFFVVEYTEENESENEHYKTKLFVYDYDCKLVSSIDFDGYKDFNPIEITKDKIGIANIRINDGFADGIVVDLEGNRITIPDGLDYLRTIIGDKKALELRKEGANLGEYEYYGLDFKPLITDEYDEIKRTSYENETNYLFAKKDGLVYLYDLSGNLLINEGFDSIYSTLKRDTDHSPDYTSDKSENVLECKKGDSVYYYDNNYELLYKLSLEEYKKQYHRYRVFYDEIKEKYYLTFSYIEDADDQHETRQVNSVSEIVNGKLEKKKEYYSGLYGDRPMDIVNGLVVYYNLSVGLSQRVVDISSGKTILELEKDRESKYNWRYSYYADGYMVFQKENEFIIINKDGKEICRLKVDLE
ncbi:MAG: hypothetical protein J5666_03665 [Bacilli bacterium]|nr:hypothetical protein [Bacilli bacterium]